MKTLEFDTAVREFNPHQDVPRTLRWPPLEMKETDRTLSFRSASRPHPIHREERRHLEA